MKKTKFLFISFLTLAFLTAFSSCASLKQRNVEEPEEISEGSFYETTLSGGIPVVIKESYNDKANNSLAIIIEKDFAFSAKDVKDSEVYAEGIMQVLFNCIYAAQPEAARPLEQTSLEQSGIEQGASAQPRPEKSRLEQTSGQNCRLIETNDYFVFMFTENKKDFAEKLAERFFYQFFNAQIEESVFKNVIESEKKKMDSFSYVPKIFFSEVRKQIYKKNPYSLSPYLTEDSVKKITYQMVCSQLQKIRNSRNIRIAACGNFDEKKAASLILLLEKNFGKIQYKSVEQAESTVSEIAVSAFSKKSDDVFFDKTELIQNERILESMQNKDFSMNLLQGCFLCPELTDEDYIPFAISTVVFESILRNSPDLLESNAKQSGCGILYGKKSVAFISAIHYGSAVQSLEVIKKSLSSFPDKSTLERTLGVYKRYYINRLISSMDYSNNEIQSLILSWIYFNEPSEYTRRAISVNSVKAEQVCAAYEKYFRNQPIKWFVLK
ncbi:MAG: insulinase family protein [Treponema sp.]|nr:insulinase family protein [Treponema sp.]